MRPARSEPMTNEEPHPIWSAPYRPFFAFGFGWGVPVLAVWLSQLAVFANWIDAPLLPRLLVADEHAHLMIWGLWGSFVCGFALTAHIRQSGHPPPSRRWLQVVFALFALSQVFVLLSWTGLVEATRLPGRVGEIAAYALVTGFAIKATSHRFRNSGFAARSLIFSLAMTVGTTTLVVHDFGPTRLAWPAVHTALWGWLVMLIAVFGSLLIPMLTRAAQPGSQAQSGRSFLVVFLILSWTLPGLRERVGSAAFAAGNTLWLCWCVAEWIRWRPLDGIRTGLLATMHAGWLWLLAALALAALRPFEEELGLAVINPTHLVTLGCLGSFIFAVATRVTLAHGGRPVRLDHWGVLAVVLVQLAAVLRVFGVALAQNPYESYAAAALMLLIAMVIWLARYGRFLLAASTPTPAKTPGPQ